MNELFGGGRQSIDEQQQQQLHGWPMTYSSADVFTTPSNEQISKKSPSSTAPWSKTSPVMPSTTTTTKNNNASIVHQQQQQQLSLIDIQREEERHMVAEQRQLQEIERQKRQVLQVCHIDCWL